VERSAGDLKAKAERLRRLHRGPGTLALPNAWDVASARILETTAGCKAIGTSSAGIAAVLGYVDREGISRAEMLDIVGRIARAVTVPVSADVEAGYGATAAEAAETARAVIAAGAVGLNLEDGEPGDPPSLVEPSLHGAKILAVRRAADEAGVPLVVNARTDGYWLGLGQPRSRFEETVERARAYLEAGADCIFVPGVTDRDTIRALARAVPGPLNVLATADAPPISELAELGVARVSVGSGFHRATLRNLQRMAQEYLEDGTYGSFTEDTLPYPELARLLQD
jgi:2-methylisocitrate lyase-like PEP mutase family enzyme